MTKQAEDFYRLQDGTQADPGDVSKGEDGVMRHKNGMAVLVDENGKPQTLGNEAVENKNVEAANAGKPADDKTDDQKPADDDQKADAPKAVPPKINQPAHQPRR